MSQSNGVKYDEGKLRYDLIPPEAMEALAHIYTMGAVKYGPNNWERGMSWSRIIGALFRHLYSWIKGDEIDKESGKSHLWHVLWNVAALVTYEARKIGVDDRSCKNKELPGFGHEPEPVTRNSGYAKWGYPNETPKIKHSTYTVKDTSIENYATYTLPEGYLDKSNITIDNKSLDQKSKLAVSTEMPEYQMDCDCPMLLVDKSTGKTYFGTNNKNIKQVQI